MHDRVKDLENRLQRNNLRMVGFPEMISTRDVKMICEKDLPEALNLPDYYLVHQIGPPPGRSQAQSSNTKDNPRQVLMRFLDFTDNEDILRAYCRLQTPLQLRGF